ncbi:hypothetical protein LCGC14_3027450, partial [marine sediment metagenome]
TKVTTKGIKVPLCSSCNQELSSWKSKYSTERNSIIDSIISNIVLIGIIIGLSMYYPGWVFIPVLIMVLEFGYFGYRQYRKRQLNSPFRYINFRGSKTYVKPKGVGSWVKYDTWLNSIARDW